MASNPSVTAVIVTYNNLELLKKCLGALRASSLMPTHIVVVDNASGDGTAGWLSTQKDIQVSRLEKNTGGAGGFHEGILQALKQNADWIWLMDDDCIVQPDSLENLLAGAGRSPRGSFYSSLALWNDGMPCRMNIPPTAWEWTDNFAIHKDEIPLSAASFVSCLIRGPFARSVGLPVKEFFIWFDDFEYTRRLAEIAPGYLVRDSLVIHETKFNRGVDWSEVNNNNVWKYKHGIRNELALIARNETFGLARAILRFFDCMSRARKGGADHRSLFTLLRWGLKGMFWDYRQCIESSKKLVEGRGQQLVFANATIKKKHYEDCEWSAVWGSGTNIMTHPPGVNAPDIQAADVVFEIEPTAHFDMFQSIVSLYDRRSQPVDFVFELYSKSGLMQREVCKVSFQSGYANFTVRIHSSQKGEACSIRLFALMSEGSTTNAFSSAIWTAPRLCKT